jgi:hypothetical protein
MARLGSGCPVCNRKLFNSRFDATFRLEDGSERFFFALPASLCELCQQLYLDPDLIELLSVPEGRCTFAIETDSVLTAARASASPRQKTSPRENSQPGA